MNRSAVGPPVRPSRSICVVLTMGAGVGAPCVRCPDSVLPTRGSATAPRPLADAVERDGAGRLAWAGRLCF